MDAVGWRPGQLTNGLGAYWGLFAPPTDPQPTPPDTEPTPDCGCQQPSPHILRVLNLFPALVWPRSKVLGVVLGWVKT